MIDKKNLQNFLKNNGLDAMLISSEANIRYLTAYSGFSVTERDAHLLLSINGVYLFTSPLYIDEVKNQIKDITIIEQTKDSSFLENLKRIIDKEQLVNIGFENDSLTVAEYLRLTAQISSHFVAKSFSDIRALKRPEEIENIKKACQIGNQVLKYLQKFLKSGITEMGVAWEMEKLIKESGAELAFPTIVAFGANSAVPHHRTENRKLKTDDIVLLDFGVKINGYCSDMSRTIFIGKPTKEQIAVFNAVNESQIAAEDFIKDKLKDSESIQGAKVDKIAREYLISKGYPSIPHSLGHGIGIQVHESPRLSPTSKDELTEGMVFSIEPGVYLINKFGVRIEDLYAIQNKKMIPLTKSSS